MYLLLGHSETLRWAYDDDWQVLTLGPVLESVFLERPHVTHHTGGIAEISLGWIFITQPVEPVGSDNQRGRQVYVVVSPCGFSLCNVWGCHGRQVHELELGLCYIVGGVQQDVKAKIHVATTVDNRCGYSQRLGFGFDK